MPKQGSGKIRNAYPVDPLSNDNLGVLAVADVAAEQARPSSPAHLIARAPYRGYPNTDWRRGPGIALTRLARLACG